MAEIWAAVLNTAEISPDDNLFDLVSPIRKTWGVDIPIQHFLEDPTVKAVSKLIQERAQSSALVTAK